MAEGIRITHSANFDRWVQGFGNMEAGFQAELARTWSQKTEAFFSRSQDYVHVITGRLKASGDASIRVRQQEVEGKVEYKADYAMAEHARGGSHAFLQRAWTDTQSEFATALTDTWENVTRNWS